MVMILVAKNDLYQKTLAKAFSLLDGDIGIYADIGEIVDHANAEIAVCFLEGQDSQQVWKLATQMPVFLILPFQNNLDKMMAADFTGIFHAPLRLGKILEAVRLYKKQKIQKEKLNKIKIGKYILNPKNNSLKISGLSSPIRLTEREQDILLYLYHHKNKPVTRQMLLDHVWGYADGVETHTLETHIYRLRQKIEKDPSMPNFLMTNDQGYYLNF